jgi:hypothetical protein
VHAASRFQTLVSLDAPDHEFEFCSRYECSSPSSMPYCPVKGFIEMGLSSLLKGHIKCAKNCFFSSRFASQGIMREKRKTNVIYTLRQKFRRKVRKCNILLWLLQKRVTVILFWLSKVKGYAVLRIALKDA